MSEPHDLKSATAQLLEVLPIEYDYHGNMMDKELEASLAVVEKYLALPRRTEADIRADEREHLMSLALGSEADEYRAYDGHVAEWLRSQGGEG